MVKAIRYAAGLAHFLAIIAIICETVAAVMLFIMATIIWGIALIQNPSIWWPVFEKITIATIGISFLITFALLYTPLYEFLSYVWRTFVTFFLTLVSLYTIIVVSWPSAVNAQQDTLLQFAFLAMIIFIAEIVLFYILYMIRGRKLSFIIRHKNALEEISRGLGTLSEIIKEKKDLDPILRASNAAYQSWTHIVKYEVLERWDISRIMFQALIISLAFFIAGVALTYQQIGYSDLVIFLGAATFVVLVLLIAIDIIRSEKTRAMLL
ncbi:MAG: hypothetical protein ACTSX9_01865 [Candidatus Njordarchaeales archaeon]